MIVVRRVEGSSYDPKEHGLHQSKRRLTRVRFTTLTGKPVDVPNAEHILGQLLPYVFTRIGQLPQAPLPMPEKLKATWSEQEQAFILRGPGLRGFSVQVFVSNQSMEDAPIIAQGDVQQLHGSQLPRLQ